MASSAGSTERPVDQAPAQSDELQKLHLLPFKEAASKIDTEESGSSGRLGAIAPALRKLRTAREVIRAGDLIRHEELEFAVIKCEPSQGVLTTDTEYYLDGNPLINFDKIQFSAWGAATPLSSDELFSQYVVKYFKGDYSCHGAPNARRVRIFYCGMVFEIDGIHLQVEAVEPNGLGVVATSTEIFALWDDTPEFHKAHIVPFQDTLPRAYNYDVFQDYLRPYLQAHSHKKFQCNELFTYHGVQFKMVACEPSSASARIGKNTTIYCEGSLHPSMRNLLSPEQLNQVAQLPPGLQMLLLNTERTTREVEDVLQNRRGLFDSTLDQVERFNWPPSQVCQQTSCMVCLADFSLGQECRRLPCNHVFHRTCVDEWLRRCTDCPICKANVDRAIRNY